MTKMRFAFPHIRWGFWLVLLAVSLPFLALLLSDLLSWDLGQAISAVAVVAAALVLGLIYWRGVRLKGRVARTGLFWVLAFSLLAMALSLYFSPDRRMGLEQAFWSIGYVVIFFLLIEMFQSGVSKSGVFYGLLTASGVVAALAALEVYAWYAKYWQGTGTVFSMPPYPYRLVSVLGHPNFYMAFVNLMAPLALVIFFRTRHRRARLFTALWLGFYLVTVPFSSSRGGWLGLAAWAGVLALLWLQDNGWGARLVSLVRRHKLPSAAALAAGLLLVSFAVFKVWTSFSSHPSHASDPFGGRLVLWTNAVQVWQTSPWFGVGVGRYLYGYLDVTNVYPPGFWSFHAHNLFLTTLAEQGIVGLAAFLALVGVGLFQLNRWRMLAVPEFRLWVSAMFAGLIGFLVHSLFDDFTTTLPVMVTVLLLASLIRGSARRGSIAPGPLPFSALFVPIFAGIALGAWLGWSGQPFAEALQQARQWQWRRAAEQADASVQRDPAFVYYHVEAGMAWARVWGDDRAPESLEKARRHLDRALEIEDSLSVVWANAAVLDWYAGDREQAIARMQEAERLGAFEPSYPLNLGWFYEQENRLSNARVEYLRALKLAPSWATHPFWQDDGFREMLSQGEARSYREQNPLDKAYWYQATQSVMGGDLEEAGRMLSLSESQDENKVAILVAKARLAEAQGDSDQVDDLDNQLLTLVSGNYLTDGPYMAMMYARFHKRAGFDTEVVPGYLKLSEDFGQFDVLARHFNNQITRENCKEAQKMLDAIKKASLGGEVISEQNLGCGYQTR